jgi:hypothetical protein
MSLSRLSCFDAAAGMRFRNSQLFRSPGVMRVEILTAVKVVVFLLALSWAALIELQRQ